MIKLLKNNFRITNDSIILGIPLIIFISITGAYLDYAQMAAGNLPSILLALITLFFMVSAFSSGWFYMTKKAIKLSKKEFVMDEDRTKAVMDLFRQIPSGIGKYFLSFLSFAFIGLLIMLLVTNIIGLIGIFTIGAPDIDSNLIKNFGSTIMEHRAFLNSLSETQLLNLFYWQILLYIGFSFTMFLTFLWVPEIIYGTKNALVALFNSIKKVFHKPLKTFLVFIIFAIIHFFMSVISTFASIHPVIYILTFILNFYVLIFSVILVFNYYEIEFLEK
jgi:hypothetical protein